MRRTLRTESVARLTLIVILTAPLLAVVAPSAAASTQTVVTFTFDDGRLTQYTNARPALASHGMHGTFFLNSGPIEKRFACCMTWSQAQEIAAGGNEIGGHTYDHKDLTDPSLTYEQAVYQVCHDRDVLIAQGFNPTSFAYPRGAYNRTFTLPDNTTKTARDVVRECGYVSGRATGGTSAGGPTYAETLPPGDPFATRTPTGSCTNNTYCEVLTAQKLRDEVTAASSHGGGWLQFVLHEVCSDGDSTCLSTTWRPIAVSEFDSFLDWLAAAGGAGGAPAGTVVRTVDQVIAGDYPPPPDAIPPVTTIECDGSPCGTGWHTPPVEVSLSATDERSGVAATRYTTDGSVPEETSPLYEGPFVITTTSTVSFRSWDNAGNVEATKSQLIRIDLNAPTVKMTSPKNGARIRGSIQPAAKATDAESGIAAVDFYVGGILVGSDSTSPYRVTWDSRGVANGTYQIVAVARDGAGNETTSAPITVTVAN